MAKPCENKKHSPLEPAPATHFLFDRQDQPHFLCESCSWILDQLGDLDVFLYEIEDWDREQAQLEQLQLEEV